MNADLTAENDHDGALNGEKPDSGISKYDMTGYVPTATTRKTRSSTRSSSISSASSNGAVVERPFPPLKKSTSRSDFGFDKSNVKYQVFGDLDE